MILLLVAGIAFLLAGLVSIVVGVPVKEFSFGNTLILAGVIGSCTGALLLGLWAVSRELRLIAADLGAGAGEPIVEIRRDQGRFRPAFPEPPGGEPAAGMLFPGEHAEPPLSAPPPPEPPALAPWQEEAAARERVRQRAAPLEIKPPPPTASVSLGPEESSAEPSAVPKRRNLLFSSSLRRDRETEATKVSEEAGETGAAAAAAPRSFDEAWPESERPRAELGGLRKRSAPADEAPAVPQRSGLLEPSPAPRSEEMLEVTVLKSGVVDGMAYSLYSDGSIEAQLPEGMMRFASIDELRDHLEQRG